ncbi:hypothetical protein [Niveibacterium terrae]|uniref:hypothetical protein n=1 Tax=Niveibacterium terrae TaxID=3373598 RepID=UPI003A951DBB
MRASWYVPNVNERRAGLRYRCLYPISALKRRGMIAELFDETRDYDAVVFDAWTLFPTVTSEKVAEKTLALAQRLKQRGTRILLDNCDNQFSGSPDCAWDRACERLRTLAAQSDTVTVCSDELASVMRSECGLEKIPRVIGDPIEKRINYTSDRLLRSVLSPQRKLSWLRYLEHCGRIALEKSRGITPLIWFGGHGNAFSEGGMLDLARITPVLAELDAHHRLSLTVISNKRAKFEQNFARLPFATHYVEWDRVNFLAMLRLHAISLIPVTRNSFTRCKSANRVTLSLYHGLNVVADEIPSYQGFAKVCALNDWREGLNAYLENPGLRRQHRQQGKALALHGYDLERIADAWQQALDPRSSEGRT